METCEAKWHSVSNFTNRKVAHIISTRFGNYNSNLSPIEDTEGVYKKFPWVRLNVEQIIRNNDLDCGFDPGNIRLIKGY